MDAKDLRLGLKVNLTAYITAIYYKRDKRGNLRAHIQACVDKRDFGTPDYKDVLPENIEMVVDEEGAQE